MANIDRDLPSGQVLFEQPAAGHGAYGEHLVWAADPLGSSLSDPDGAPLASFEAGSGTYTVDLARLDVRDDASRLVPYVNVFLGGTARVEKYWRTKRYRTVALEGAAPVAAPVPVAATPAAVAPTVVATPQPQPVAGSIEAVPGVEVPKKTSAKRFRKGYSKVGSVVVRDEHLDTLNDAWALAQAGRPSSVLITGPAGTAKTALARAFASTLGVPYLKVDAGAVRTADDWAGAFRQDPNSKVWAHRWSAFAQALRLGQPVVILVDEITRTESPQALNAFMGLLDWTGRMLVPDANEVLERPAGVLIVATANIGPEFVGTLPLDGAIRQRFPFGIRMDYPDEAVEAEIISDLSGIERDLATRLVTMAVTQRANRMDPQMYPSGSVISTRVLLDIAGRISTCSRDPRAAVLSTLSGQFDPGDDAALSVVVDTQFPAAPIEDDEDIVEVDAADQDGVWKCPSCGRENQPDMVVCWGHDCTYTRPSGGGATIRLQNKSYQP